VIDRRPFRKAEDLVAKGDELSLLVIRVNDVEGTVMLSKKRLDAAAGFEKVMNAAETGEILEGVVTEVIKGGVLVLSNGIRVFIPASHATLTRGEPLENLLKKQVKFKILDVNRQRRRAVGSIRAVSRELRKAQEEKFWTEAEGGRHYDGTVKSLTDYGAFIDLGGVDGMAHISELSWGKIRHPSQVVNVGDKVDVYIKDLDPEKKKVSLGYRKDEDNPWTILKNNYSVGQTAHVKIVSLTTFGAFAELIPGVDGLIHISQIARERVGKPGDVLKVGDEVDVKITELDFERNRISLSIRALLEEQAAAADQAAMAGQAAAAQAAQTGKSADEEDAVPLFETPAEEPKAPAAGETDAGE
jgi:4-hydroxy-3-methylbut-2-enyl diphosphate reductase